MADILYRPKGNGTTPPNNPCDDCHFRIHNPLNPLDHGVVPSDAFGKLFKFNVSTGLPEACPFGIADTNAVRIDSADVADNEYARFTANGLESRSYAEVLSDIGAQAAGSYLTDAPSDGTTYGRKNGAWSDAAGASGANTALSNLAAVAINTSLISDTDSTDDLGSSTKYWANLYVDTIFTPAINGGAAANDDITIQGTTHATRDTSYVILQPTDGNVGIGTATPAQKLDVNGNITASRLAIGLSAPTGTHILDINATGTAVYVGMGDLGGTGPLFYIGSDGTTAYLSSRNNQPLAFWANNTEYIRLLTNGNVGIGMTAPSCRLDLGNVIDDNSLFKAGCFQITSKSNNEILIGLNYSHIHKYIQNGHCGAIYFYDGHISLQTGPSGIAGNDAVPLNRLRVLNTGEVGISTISPVTRLDLGSNLTTNSLFKAGLIEIHSQDTLAWIAFNLYVNSGNYTYRSTDYGSRIKFYGGGVYIDTAPSGSANGTATLTNRFYLTQTGLLALGVATPTAVLHLKAGTVTASTAPLKFTSGTLLGTAEAGAVEFLTDDYFVTITTGAARKGIILDNGSRLTSGKIPIATTNGRLVDVTPQTELTDELTTITCSAPGTPDYAIADPVNSNAYGFASADEFLSVLKALANAQTRINELETKLVALGLLADAD